MCAFRTRMEVLPLLLTFLVVFTSSQDCGVYIDKSSIRPGIIGKVYNVSDTPTYPHNCTDIILTFDEDVEIKFHELNIDGQSGDFVLVSPLPPIPPDPDAEEIAIEEIMPIGEFTLFSWTFDKSGLPRSINLLSPSGSFLYFHGEVSDRNSSLRSGFIIEILPYDKPLSTAPTTTEREFPTPNPQDEAFIVRYLTGKHPGEFLTVVEDFKAKVASMATSYCNEEGIVIPLGIWPEDVLVPEKEIRFCDEKWPEYANCVEVKFAVAVLDSAEKYAMTKPRLDSMWSRFNSQPLQEIGLKSLTPPENEPEIVPWVWAGAMLGVIVVFSVGLCAVWLRGVTDEIHRDSHQVEQIPTDENAPAANRRGESPDRPFYDPKNPISKEIDQNPSIPTVNIELVEQRRLVPGGGSGSGQNQNHNPIFGGSRSPPHNNGSRLLERTRNQPGYSDIPL